MPRKTRRRSRKAVPWAGWSKISPKGHARTVMKRKCGKKCFLGPKKSFPVCAKGTCKINKKGLYAAYVRAVQIKMSSGQRNYLAQLVPLME